MPLLQMPNVPIGIAERRKCCRDRWTLVQKDKGVDVVFLLVIEKLPRSEVSRWGVSCRDETDGL